MGDKALSVREKLARLRASFIEQLPARLAEARRHYERLIADPADRAAAVELHRFLHSIKGTGRSFGLDDLSTAAAHAEDLAASLLGADTAPPPFWQDMLVECLDGMAEDVKALQGSAAAATQPDLDLNLPKAGEATRRSGRLVYLCDDEEQQIEQIAVQLGCFGFETVAFADPARLVEAARARPPDAVVMDINFPAGDHVGTDALKTLAAQLGKPIPAVFLSARADFAARLAAVQSGSVAYFPKPARVMDLVSVLDDITRQQNPEPHRIMIVDDEPEIAGYHAIILQEAGMITYQVTDPAKVLDGLRDFRPDMVLMDMYMPVCSGRELARLIRQVPEYVGLPIVYLSSETDKQKQFSAMRVGAEGFLTKPVVPEDLVTAVGIRAERMRTLRSLMARDSLTGLFNHTTTSQLLENAINTAKRSGAAVSFAMIDIDRFKSVNDTYGHPVGDQVILALARLLQQRLRNTDIVGRYGGEEFAVVLPDVAPKQAARLIDDLREDFSRIAFHGGETEFTCSFSAGVAGFPRHKRMEILRETADRVLYEAKRSGRNRVLVDPEEP